MSKVLKEEKEKEVTKKEVCFVIMPISDVDGYEPGHFKLVYEDIFKPAIEAAGYLPMRADDTLSSNFIQLDILKALLDSPMAICDLSSRNPNVLYELGFRQAFDKATVLIKDLETINIFDISFLRYTEYDRRLTYRNVKNAQESVKRAIVETRDEHKKKGGINSLVSMLSISKAIVKPIEDMKEKDLTSLLIRDLKNAIYEIKNFTSEFQSDRIPTPTKTILIDENLLRIDEFEKAIRRFEKLIDNKTSREILSDYYDSLNAEYNKLMEIYKPPSKWFYELLNLNSKLNSLHHRVIFKNI